MLSIDDSTMVLYLIRFFSLTHVIIEDFKWFDISEKPLTKCGKETVCGYK